MPVGVSGVSAPGHLKEVRPTENLTGKDAVRFPCHKATDGVIEEEHIPLFRVATPDPLQLTPDLVPHIHLDRAVSSLCINGSCVGLTSVTTRMKLYIDYINDSTAW